MDISTDRQPISIARVTDCLYDPATPRFENELPHAHLRDFVVVIDSLNAFVLASQEGIAVSATEALRFIVFELLLFQLSAISSSLAFLEL